MENTKIKRTISLLLALIMAVTLVFTGCGKKEPNEKVETKPQVAEEKKSKSSEATIVASGDMLYHMPVINAARTCEGEYDFKSQFKEIKPIISQADLAIGDFEGSIMPGKPLSGYPVFNAPTEVAEAAKYAGYDVITVAQKELEVFPKYLSGAL